MDTAMMKKTMEDTREALNKNEREHQVLTTLLKGFEDWFQINPEEGSNSKAHQYPLLSGRGGPPLGTISYSKGAMKVVKDARGAELGAKVIWERMEGIGVKSNAKNPVGLLNVTLNRHTEVIEKTAPRTWKWIGPLSLNGHESE